MHTIHKEVLIKQKAVSGPVVCSLLSYDEPSVFYFEDLYRCIKSVGEVPTYSLN